MHPPLREVQVHHYGGRPSDIFQWRREILAHPSSATISLEGGLMLMYITLSEFIALGMFVIALITLVILISDHIRKK